MLLPCAVANCGQLRDVSPHFVPLYSLSSKFSIESGFETRDPEALEMLCLWGPITSLALQTLQAEAAAGSESVAGKAGARGN